MVPATAASRRPVADLHETGFSVALWVCVAEAIGHWSALK